MNEKFLCEHLGMSVEQLAMIDKIDMKVDTSEDHLQAVGEVMISLVELKLNDSIIKSARDLGTSFTKVKIL